MKQHEVTGLSVLPVPGLPLFVAGDSICEAITVATIAGHYSGLINGLVIDETDTEQGDKVWAAGAEPLIARSIMTSDEDRINLARHILTFARAFSDERLCRA
ncbi:hypothetical protein [Sphingobium fuliginis]|uniref:Uncharacterized protein n=1 Tax=Sphingobium fuliginis ATCC 27551 TaxID=1208342 RepID=A0A5B8CFB5_SPHSA|nr:hypothetical protein [Sphingobium fuliginis]QDC37769.1 hypothetical protein FIL70_11570 [Sphingobium fuliginis ATCC 27551]